MIKLSEETLESFRITVSNCIPQLSINTVIFRYYKKSLQFAVVRLVNGNLWLIPGGYVRQDESVTEAARRNLREQTHLEDLILFEFGSFGSTGRRMEGGNSDIEQMDIPYDVRQWITQRFVTIAYYSIVSDPDLAIKVSPLYSGAKWLNIEENTGLAMDHSDIVTEAVKTLANDLLSRPLLLSFMPAEFTIPELQKLYEAILSRPVDRGNFRKRMLKSDFLIKTGQIKGNTDRRPPELYQINKEKYLNSLTEDVKLGF